MDLNLNINKLPVTTYNWLKMNGNQIFMDEDFSKINENFEIKNQPDGISVKDISKEQMVELASSFNREIQDKTNDLNPANGQTYGRDEQVIKTGLGKDFDEFLKKEDINTKLITVEKSLDDKNPMIINFHQENDTVGVYSQLIHVKENVNATIIMSYDSASNAKGVEAISTKVLVEKNSNLKLIKLQTLGKKVWHFDDIGSICKEKANLDLIQIELGGQKNWTGAFVELVGNDSTFNNNMGYYMQDEQVLDMNYVVSQRGEKTESKMLFKGALNDEAQKTWRGTIDFHKGSSGSKGDEQEDVLLVSPDIVNKSIPLILCHEEDVDGRHGASIGQLEEDELFYFQARGISREEAQKIMIKAQLNSIAELLPLDDEKDKIEAFITEKVSDEFDVQRIRKDFPIFESDYIYLDSAATSQRPKQVLDAVVDFYQKSNANPLRGLYDLSIDATDRYEDARKTVANFIGAKSNREIIFTRNTSESLNLVAYSYGLSNVNEGDEIVTTIMEHHSNMLPWQMVAKEKKAKLIYLEPNKEGVIEKSEYESKITPKTKIVAIAHVSNVLGVTNPVKEIAEYAHKMGAIVVVDGAQSTPHMEIDVNELGADFFAFSGHKMLAPMGIGVLYGRLELLEKMPPFLVGGEMIEYVTREGATYAEVPHKFEAGTVNAADAVGLAEAINYIKNIGFEAIHNQELLLTERLMSGLKKYDFVKIYGSSDPKKHCGIVTFTIDGVHPHDVSTILNEDKICVRAGNHCAQPLVEFLGASSTARVSVYFYNTLDEVDTFLDKIKEVREVMGYGA
nr:SufS family cysteine desulfurase [Lachnobacterium bovis]